MDKKYDCFISHASEDKEDFVRPLVKELQKHGLEVWYDEFELRWGNSIRKTIDKGLSDSTCGIVVLSHNFFNKNWPQTELDALYTIKDSRGQDLIIPIWHNITKEEVTKYSSIIASLFAGKSTEDMKIIVDNIQKIVNELKKNINSEGELSNHKNIDIDKKHMYMEYIIKPWCEMIDINNWDVWTSHMLSSGQPQLSAKMMEQLNKTREWLLSRVWTNGYEELTKSFKNFRNVLEDLCRTFSKRAKNDYGNFLFEKFYKYSDNEEEMHKQFEFEVYLVEDLVLELTRAANYICEQIRKYVEPSFRLKEGHLLITYGPLMDLSFKTRSVSYDKSSEKFLYTGLEEFKKTRETRDFHMGAGTDIADPKFLKWYNNY